MFKRSNCVMILFILLCTLIFFNGMLCASPLKIKGFYIGMNIDDTLKNFEGLGFEGLNIRENTYKKNNKFHSIGPGSGDRFKVETGLNSKTVVKIVFSSCICNRLFNTQGIH